MYSLPLNWHGRKINVALLGAGGTGSALAHELIRLTTALEALDPASGLNVTVYDGSDVTEANIARQSFFPTQIGNNKAEATVWTANNLYGLNWTSVPKNIEKVPNNCDVVITAVDRPSVRYKISQENIYRRKVLWLDLGNSSVDGQVVLGELGKNKYLPTICDLYDYQNLSDDDALKKSCSAQESLTRQEMGVNQFAARIGTQILWNLFRHGSISSHGAYFNVRTLHTDPIMIDPSVWAIYGYVPEAQPQENK